MEQATKEGLMADVNTVLADAEGLLRQAAQASGEQASELRRRAQSAIARRISRARFLVSEHRVVDQAKRATRATDGWVHEHPWTAVGIAAGIGVLIGLVVNRR